MVYGIPLSKILSRKEMGKWPKKCKYGFHFWQVCIDIKLKLLNTTKIILGKEFEKSLENKYSIPKVLYLFVPFLQNMHIVRFAET